MRKINIVYEEEQFYVEQQPFSRQWLYEEYITKSRGANDLAKEIGIGRDLFFQICKVYGLSKQRESHITWDGGNIICKGQKIDLQALLEYYQTHDVQEV